MTTKAHTSTLISALKSTLLERLGHSTDPNTLADDQTFLLIGFN